jgi:hypothetical protein
MAILSEREFFWKYSRDFPSATFEQWDAAYNEYKDFYVKYHQDNPGATTSCYEEYLKTKQGKQHTFGRIEEQRGEEFEYCYWVVLYCKRGSWALLVEAEQSRSRARLYINSFKEN